MRGEKPSTSGQVICRYSDAATAAPFSALPLTSRPISQYPSISGKRLIWALARKIKDKRFLRTVYSIIESCGGGLAIGYYICQWLANFYLEPLDRYIMTLPGVKYMTRYMDNITLLGPNKKQLHKARKLIAAFMQQRLGLSMKANWQIYPTAKRMVSAVGYRFSRTHVILRKRNFLRFTRQCRRVKKRLDAGKPIMFAQASGLLSRAGQLKHCNSHTIRVKYIDPIGVKHLKEVVRNESTLVCRMRRNDLRIPTGHGLDRRSISSPIPPALHSGNSRIVPQARHQR